MPSASRIIRALTLHVVALSSGFAADKAADAPPNYAALTAAARQANASIEPVAPGPYGPSWDSLKQYRFPDWFRDAKFGIWAHWGPQCEPEQGDWYTRNMYSQRNKKGEPNPIYEYHLKNYGHPSTFGFKDVIPLWKADRWEPDQLMALYKKAGARYFMALANHHDNFDTWDSKYQPWNSANIGPRRDLIAGWEKAARAAGLRFGVSVHAARAWGWNNVSTGSDQDGPLKGVPYDGVLTEADGHGKWWDGLDPQDLYAQTYSAKKPNGRLYLDKFYNRTMDLINRTHPDLLYFDDDITRGLPLYNDDPTIGLRIAAHLYNSVPAATAGHTDALIAAKKLSLDRRSSLLFDIERGGAEDILPDPWQTDTCIGRWHYDRGIGEHNGYKKSGEIIRQLADIVSKNGNLMLSIPVRGNGTIDDNEIRFLQEMGEWLNVNGEAIYATRPWKQFGEGPVTEDAAVHLGTGEVIEKKVRPLGAEDIRFTTSKDGSTLYAIVCGVPTGPIHIRALAAGQAKIAAISLLGDAKPVTWRQSGDGLVIEPSATWPSASAVAYRVRLTP